jgi:hypothetical protein
LKVWMDFLSLIEMMLPVLLKVFLMTSSDTSEGMNLTKMLELKVLVRFYEIGLILSPAKSFSLLLTNWFTIKN